MKPHIFFLAIITLAGLLAAGCGQHGVSPAPVEMRQSPPETHKPAPRREHKQAKPAPRPAKPMEVGPSSRPMTDAQKQQAIHDARLNLIRTFVSAREHLPVGLGEEAGVAKEELTSYLAGIGFNVIQSTQQLPPNPTEAQQNRFRRQNNCNLVFLVDATVLPRKGAGRHRQYACKLKGSVLNLTTHQIIASKRYDELGKIAQHQDVAIKSAVEAAMNKLKSYLSAEAVRKWEELSLYRVHLTMHNLATAGQADSIRAELQRRQGVFYVSLDSWDENRRTARYDVLIRRDAKDYLVQYIEELRKSGVRILDYEKGGKTIRALSSDFQ